MKEILDLYISIFQWELKFPSLSSEKNVWERNDVWGISVNWAEVSSVKNIKCGQCRKFSKLDTILSLLEVIPISVWNFTLIARDNYEFVYENFLPKEMKLS